MKKVLILINDSTYAYNLRGAIINRLVSEGYRVTIVCQLLKHQEELKKMGAKLISVETGRHGTNPINDIRLYKEYCKILKDEKPDIVLTYNIKPNVYGGLACQKLNIDYIPNITGLGTPVENPGLLQKITVPLYKKGVKGARCVFFQNEENKKFFYDHKMLDRNIRTILIPGSGVDLSKHNMLPWNDEDIHFLFAARIMKQKGIEEFLAAANKYASDKIIFDVCGFCDDENYTEILKNNKNVVYHGEQKDLTSFYRKCTCFLYPSYYPEGMSNVLLESAASGRPVIACDRAGCRETVEDGITGFIVPIMDSEAVMAAVGRLLDMTNEQRKNMGIAGNAKIAREFDRQIVVEAYMKEIEKGY